MSVDDQLAGVTAAAGATAANVDAAEAEQSSDALKRALRAVRDMKARVTRAEDAAHEPIAIVGVGCRFPGADDPAQYWQLLRDGVDAINDVPADRWDIDEYYDPDPTMPGKMVSRQGGFLRDVDQFDPRFFGITPREAVTMDPQQRLLIEVAWEALESAGIAPSALSGSSTATFVGMTPGQYWTIGNDLVERGALEIDAYIGTGNAMSVTAGRIAYALGLHGPNLALDTACSSSLVAVHLGVQSLRRGEADAAIVGGVSVMLDPSLTVYMSQAGALSPTDRCHTFDASADGYVRGEGCGVAVLKRLSDAVRDGDNVLAVVHGTAINHDGRSGGLTVPNGHAQQAVIRAALADARIEPASVSYVEAHGTGTPLGDPIEARALDAVYREDRDGNLLIGSAKTNFGHLEAAAGIAGLLKLVLSLQHGTIPAHLHFEKPSPHIDWASACLEVTDRPVDWVGDERPRLAGLSSFGLSGTNCHVIVGDPPDTVSSHDSAGTVDVAAPAGPRVLTLSAGSADAVRTLAGEIASTLRAPDAPALADAAHTLNTGRNELAHRLAVVAADRDEAVASLERYVAGERDASVTTGDVTSGPAPKIAFLFSGQGAQYLGMGRELYDANNAFRAALDECDERFRPHLGRSLRSLIHAPAGADSPIDDTTYTQPALFALEYALAQMWTAWGVRPDMMLGHSIGGIVAAHLGGIMSFDDAVDLVAARGRLMGALPAGGSMLAVFADETTVAAALPRFAERVTIAAINGPDNVVISGPRDDVAAAAASFGDDGVETRPLATSHAFHSPLMDPVLAEFESVASKAQLTRPRGRRLVSDHTGALGADAMATAAYWVRHLREPVRFADGIATLHDAGCNVFVEIGPSPTLTVMAQRCIPDADAAWLPSLVRDRPEPARVLTTLAELWTRGVGIDWQAFDPPGSRRRVLLPTTPFQRSRYWLPEPTADHIAPGGGHPLLGARSSSPGRDVRFDTQLTPARATFLHDYVMRGQTELPAVAHAETLFAAGAELWGHDVPLVVSDLEVHEVLEVGDEPLHHQTTVSPVGRTDAGATIDARRSDTGEWDHLADARLSIDLDRTEPARVDLTSLCDGLEPVSIDDLLSNWSDAGLVLGDRFRCITQLWSSGERTVAELALPHDAVRYSSYPPALAVCALALRGDGVVRRVARIGALRQYSSNPAAWCEMVPDGGGGSLRFIDEAGDVVAELGDVVLVEDVHDRLPARAEWCYDVAWTESAAVDLTATPSESRWAVIGADDGLSRGVCERLATAGVEGERIDESALDDHTDPGADDEAGLRALVRQWLDPTATDRPLSNIVYVVASDETVDPADRHPVDNALARTTRLLRLVQTLADEAWSAKVATPPRIWLVTRAAMAAGNHDVAPDDRALWSMMKTVAAELPAFYGGMVDLDPAPAPTDDESRQIVGAIAGSGDETWLAIRGDKGRVARLRPDPPALDRPPLALRADGAYLVTGGFGALGMATARWLTDRGARRLIMLGRTAVPPRTEWAELRPDDAAATRVDAIRELEALGAIVHHPAVDVADRDALQAVLDDYRAAGWPPIRGVFHAAGELRDRSIPQMEAADVATVFSSKARGAWNLHCLLADEPLDHFVCYSSVAAALGSPGQANYAAANGFLDGLAHLRRRAGRAGLSVNWGPWSAGMAAADEVERRRERRGVPPIPVIGGLAVLGELLAADATQAVVMPMTAAQWSMVESPLVADLVPADDATTRSVDDIGAELLTRSADERSSIVLEAVRGEVAAVAGLGIDDVPAELGLVEVGLDSIMIVELATTLSRRFAVALDPREIFEEPSLTTLAATLLAAVEAGRPEAAADGGPGEHVAPAVREAPAPRSGCTIVMTTAAAGATEIGSLIEHVAPAALLDRSWAPSIDSIEALGDAVGLHVSESLGDDPDGLESLAEQIPGSLRFVHLTRHPFAVIEELVDDHGLSQRDAEEVWTTLNGNLLDFAERIGPERMLVVRYEELVTDPSGTIDELVRFGALPPPDRSLVDLPSVQPELAQRWRSAVLMQRPGRGVRRLAEDLGYEADWPVDIQGGHPVPVTPAVAPDAAPARDAAIPALARRHGVQASPAQERLLFLDDFRPGLAVHNLPVALRLTGTFDREAWASAITEVVRRHEVIRTNYEAADGTYVQVIEPPREVTVRYEDLRSTPRAELDETIDRAIAAESAEPFDLGRDLKLRAATFQVDDDVHVVMLTMHHIASDGWSVLRVLGELFTLYGAAVSGGVPTLPELSIQYADYAAWQREQLRSPALQQQLAYWTDQLGGTLPVLDLPTDRPRPSPRSYRSDVLYFEVPGELVDAIRTHSRTQAATPFMTLLAAYAATLARHTGQSDVIIGTANANRQRTEVTDLVGLFVNTLALRVAVDEDETFDELLAGVRRVSLDANRNQDVPFDRIVEVVRPPRDVTRSAIYQTMFTLHNMRPPEVHLPGVDVDALTISSGELDVDLSIELTDTGGVPGDPMQGMLRFNVDLFDRVTMERLVGSWLTMLSVVTTGASTRLTDVDLVGVAERAALESWCSSTVDLGDVGGMRIEELFAAQVGRSPDAVAVVAGEDELTFAELDAASNRMARRLRAVGVAPGDVVGVGVERSVSMVVALLAVLKTGAAYVPLDPGFPAQRLAFMVSDADVSVVLTSGSALIDRLDAADAATVEGLTVIDVVADAEVIAGESDDPLEVDGHDAALDACGLAYVIYTSGSTGVPKGVQIEHRNVVNFLLSMRDTPGLTDDDVLLGVTTLSFDISVLEIFLPLVTGARLVLAGSDDTIDGARLARLIASSQATVMQATPTTWSMLIESGWGGDDSLRVLCGGEAMSRGLADGLVARCGELWNMFGPTETTIWSTLMQIEPDGAGAVPIGSPIANTVCRILDRNDLQQPIGVPGELCIGGAGVARGYLDRPELTAERFVADPYSDDPAARLYRTGDLARWRNDGTIEFLGRLDHQVKVRGHRIELGEIETALRSHPAIAEAVVIVREDQPGDQRITAYLTLTVGPQGDTTPPDAAELRRHLAGDLPDYMIPSAYVALEEFPQTPNRKIDRNALPRPDTQTTVERVEPSSDLERQLCAVWAEVLGVESPGVTQTFFELGGHSLLATRLVSRMSSELGVDVGVRAIFEHPTIADLAASMGAEGGTAASSDIGRVDRDGALPLSFAQERMWFLQQFEDDTSALNIRAAVRIRGSVDAAVLARSIDAVIERHEMLRTVYDDVMGQPVPRVLEHVATPLVVDDRRGTTDSDADPEAVAAQVLSEEADRVFDLTSEPPVLIRLVRLADDELLSVVTHHIASDGLSIPILLRDLSAFYAAFSSGTDPVLPELPIDYVDYAAWQRSQESDTFHNQLDYWTAQLAGDLGNCELPTDHPRPPVHTVEGAQIGRTIPEELVDGLRELGRRNGATLFMALLAPFVLVLDRRIGRDDRSVTIGTPVAGRVRPELEDLIGVFLNTLVLRTDVDGDPTFDELLGRVRNVSLDAFANQDVPFEQLLAELQPPRDLSRTPFFSIFFNMLNVDVEPSEGTTPRLVGHEFEFLEQPEIGSKFDLTMYLGEQRRADGGGVWMQLVYNRHLYDPTTMQELFDQYVELLETVVADPGRPISTYSLVTDAARELLPDIGAELDDTWHGSVPEHVRRHAAESPDRPAVTDGSTSWRYDELANDMNRLANWLGDRGVQPGDVVAILGHRSASLVWAVTGALAAGAGYTILDPTYPPARLAEYIRIVRPKAFVHLEAGGPIPDDVANELDELGVVARLSLPARRPAEGGGPLDGAASDPPHVTIGPDDLACVTMTSGSTGEPKAVLGRHGSLTHFLPWQSDAFHVDADDRFSMLSGLAHDPIQRDMFWPLAIGASIVVPDPDQIPAPGWLARWMRAERVTVAHLTPAMGQLVLEAPQTATDADAPIEPLRLALFIGEPLPRDLVDRLQARAPDVTVVNLYGTTETQRASGHLVLERPADLGDRTIVPLGVGIPGTQLLVRSEEGTEAGIGEIGEIWMRSHHLALGYLDRPADTATRFSVTPGAAAPTDRMYRTGDLGRYRVDGSVEFVGRTDQQVQIRGFRVELGDVRAALCDHDDVEDSVVVVRDDQSPARLVAYVVDSGTAPAPAELSAFLRSRLPAHMVPTAFVSIPAIPLTPNGKLDRAALPEPITHEVEEGAGARDSLEQLLVGLWEDVLDRPGIGIHDNFFDLGGYSLLATRLFALLEDAIGERIPVATLFQAPTIEELAAVIRDSGWESRWSSLVPIQPRGTQPPLYYVNSYLISVLQLAQLGEELGEADQPLYGLQPRGIDGDLPPLDTIEDMAAHYISEIKSLQPHGPYVLGGHCSGAWVAFEMASQLEQMGDDVTAVLLVDLGPPGVERPEIPTWRYVVHRLKFFYGDGRLRHALGWQLKIAVNRLLLRRMGSEAVRTQGEVQAAHHRAHRDYTGGPVSCSLVLIRSHETLALGDRGWFLKWQEKTSGELFVADHVVGVHSDMLDQPNVKDLAAKMLESIAWAREQQPIDVTAG